jgi:hypothetical protein
VQRYTLAQVRFYGKAIDRERRRRERAQALIARAAYHYEPDNFQTFLEE